MNQAMATKLNTVAPSAVLSGFWIFHNSQPPLDTVKFLNFIAKKQYTELAQHSAAVQFRGKSELVRKYGLK